jgi:phosphoribosylformylglycinamidine cyclo-ligase
MPLVFEFLRKHGDVPEVDMYRTFNMGIGLVLVCSRTDLDSVLTKLISSGEVGAGPIGEIREGESVVEYAEVEFQKSAE